MMRAACGDGGLPFVEAFMQRGCVCQRLMRSDRLASLLIGRAPGVRREELRVNSSCFGWPCPEVLVGVLNLPGDSADLVWERAHCTC